MQHTLNKDLAVAIGFCKDRNATAFFIENALRRAKRENEADHAPSNQTKKWLFKTRSFSQPRVNACHGPGIFDAIPVGFADPRLCFLAFSVAKRRRSSAETKASEVLKTQFEFFNISLPYSLVLSVSYLFLMIKNQTMPAAANTAATAELIINVFLLILLLLGYLSRGAQAPMSAG